MFRRILLGCLILMLPVWPASYAQITTSSKVIKAKPPKKVKAPKVKKAPKPPKPAATKLTPDEKAAKKANDKNIHTQRKAFEKQNKEQVKELKAQRNEQAKQLKAQQKALQKTANEPKSTKTSTQ